MKAHELANYLLKCEDLPVIVSVDISTCDEDSGRRIFTDEIFEINNYKGDAGEIILLTSCYPPEDNYGRKF